MHLLPKPPKFAARAEKLGLMLDMLKETQVQDYLADANKEYYHWEKLRHRPTPEGLTPEEAWTLVKWVRRLGRAQPLPLLDVKGRPFSYWLPDPALAVLHEVDRGGGSALAVHEKAAPFLGVMRDRVLVSSLMEEAIATSQIEGAVTTRKVAKEMLRTNRKPRDRGEQMIVNSYRTILHLRERLDRPLSIDLLNEIQESMTRETLDDPSAAGRFRTAEDDVRVIDVRDNEVVFTPPPAEQLGDRLEQLFTFANAGEGNPFIHPLVRAAILHFWLAYEHPYVDGNGRTARALFYWYMLKRGYWLFEFLTISRSILAAPMKYYRSFLYSENDDNDLTYSILFLLRATHQALDQLWRYLAAKQEEQKRTATALRRFPGLNYRQRALLDHALRHPSQLYTFQSHQNSHGITYVTARVDLLNLAKYGLLHETKAGRQHAFVPAEDLAEKLAPSEPTKAGRARTKR